MSELASIASTVVAFIVQLGIPAALFVWGRRVAASRGNTRGYRIAAWLPIVGFVLAQVGIIGTVIGLVHAFGALGRVDAQFRAQHLAEGISEAMNATAFGLGMAILLYATSLCVSLYGTLAKPAGGKD
jgi:hypothetical protein